MNPQTKRERKATTRQYHGSEVRRAPHRQPPSNRETVEGITDRDRPEGRGGKALLVAQPVRRSGHQAVPESSAREAVPVPASRPVPRRGQFDVRMAFTIFGFSVAAVLVVLFGMDLAMGVPLGRVSWGMDVAYVICGLILGGLSWSCYCELR